jgi:4'-phosphopantetheinyl transferase
MRFAMTHLTRRFVASHAALRVMLGRILGIAPEAVQFRYGAKGKPSLVEGLGADELKFNLSHSGDAAVIAITERREVGIDLEQTNSHLDVEPLAAQFFAPAEHSWVVSTPSNLRCEAFYICWTAKEAYVKARGDGLSFELSDFEVLPSPKGDGLRLTVYQDAAEATRWTLRRLDLPAGWVGAIAVEACP